MVRHPAPRRGPQRQGYELRLARPRRVAPPDERHHLHLRWQVDHMARDGRGLRGPGPQPQQGAQKEGGAVQEPDDAAHRRGEDEGLPGGLAREPRGEALPAVRSGVRRGAAPGQELRHARHGRVAVRGGGQGEGLALGPLQALPPPLRGRGCHHGLSVPGGRGALRHGSRVRLHARGHPRAAHPSGLPELHRRTALAAQGGGDHGGALRLGPGPAAGGAREGRARSREGLRGPGAEQAGCQPAYGLHGGREGHLRQDRRE
mmetsp:Transcript_104741/g.327810  ORF Transcript_104741/g.327810 Transcript_104741/m.327810 type:complete len:260 (-) Transcript_104741:314-1093(-)